MGSSGDTSADGSGDTPADSSEDSSGDTSADSSGDASLSEAGEQQSSARVEGDGGDCGSSGGGGGGGGGGAKVNPAGFSLDGAERPVESCAAACVELVALGDAHSSRNDSGFACNLPCATVQLGQCSWVASDPRVMVTQQRPEGGKGR